jgi:hypothetical protein
MQMKDLSLLTKLYLTVIYLLGFGLLPNVLYYTTGLTQNPVLTARYGGQSLSKTQYTVLNAHSA